MDVVIIIFIALYDMIKSPTCQVRSSELSNEESVCC